MGKKGRNRWIEGVIFEGDISALYNNVKKE
jgi:hypothetical protein